MRIVLDACVPHPLRHDISGHHVATAHYLGLEALADTDLIDAIEGHFDVFVTCDRSIPWQNKFAGRLIAILVLRAPTNKLSDLWALVPEVLRVLPFLRPGEVREIALP